MSRTIRTEIAILGGGPAGSVLALKLALLGHKPILIEKQSFPRQRVGESIPASILPLLDSCGLRQVVECAGFLRPRRAFVEWAGTLREMQTEHESGFQVDRALFDEILLDAALRSGVTVFHPAHTGSIAKNEDASWTLSLTHYGAPVTLHAKFLADATGRACLTRGPRIILGTKTLALWAHWKIPNSFGPETRVESGEEGWFWGAPLPNGTFNATVLLNGKSLSDQSRQDRYKELLQSSSLLRDCTRSTQITDVQACDATPSIAEEIVSETSIKIGEAAFSIDPLSSQGVQAAIGSAIHGALFLHTVILRPISMQIAMDFYRRRQYSSYERHDRQAMDFYRQARNYHGTQFWMDRARETEAPSVNDVRGPLPQPDSLLFPSLTLRPALVPCVCGDFIELREGFHCQDSSDPLVFVAGTLVTKILEKTHWPSKASHLVKQWSADIGQQAALNVLADMWQGGLVSLTRSGQRSAPFH